MAFEWNSIGHAPAPDVPEISVFGPGYGEAIVIHVGGGEWIVIDSCVESGSGNAVSTTYLERIGVDVGNAVRFVVASHWHDDHIRGLSEVVRRCRTSTFVSAKVLTTKEFYQYAARFNNGNTSAAGSGTGEFQRVHSLLLTRSHTPRKWAGADRRLHQFGAFGSLPACQMWSLSPSDEEYSRFLNFLTSTMPNDVASRPRRRAATQGPNDASVVIGLEWGAASAVLGSDLETFAGATRGWGAIVTSTGRPQSKAGYVKVPHHGGYSAHHEGMWSQMLLPNPIATLTPFARGKGLPTADDRTRLTSLTNHAYITANPKSKSISQVAADRSVQKMLAEAKISLREGPDLGLVRARFERGTWRIELFNQAKPIASVA